MDKLKVFKGKSIMCKMDVNGVIEYANDYFIELCGFKQWEIIGKDLAANYTNDMPKLIMNYTWENILKKKKTNAIIKFKSKSMEFFWLQVKFDYKIDEKTREVRNIYLYGQPLSQKSIEKITKIYTNLSNLENQESIASAEKYLAGYLEGNNLNFEQFFDKFLTL